jgi:hypothetical protein
MTCSTETARAEMFAAVVTGLAGIQGITMKWQGKDSNDPPVNQSPYIFASINTANEAQSSLANAFSKMRWKSEGTLMVQCFAPLNKGSIDAAMGMALALKRHFRKLSTPGGVWFRNVSAKEGGASAAWYQVNFKATFSFDELQ